MKSKDRKQDSKRVPEGRKINWDFHLLRDPNYCRGSSVVEQLTRNEQAEGSIPSFGSKYL